MNIGPVSFQVNRLVSKAETKKGFKQVSNFKSALTSEFYFFPGLQHGMVSSHSEMDMAESNSKSQCAPAPMQTSVPRQSASVQQAPSPVQTSKPLQSASGQQAQSTWVSVGMAESNSQSQCDPSPMQTSEPQQSASEQQGQSTMGSGLTAQPSDGVDGGNSVLVW